MSAFKIAQNIETVAVSSVGISTGSPIPLKTGYLRINSDENVYIDVSPTPTLSTSSLWISAGDPIIIKETVTSQRVAGIETGTTTTIYLPQGTFCQFNIGDYVQITGIGFTTDLDTDFAEVLSIDTTQGSDGGYARKLILDYDTSSVLYPYNYVEGANVYGPIILPGGISIPSPAQLAGISYDGNVKSDAEIRRVVKIGAMGDGQAANVHITEIQIAGG